MLNIGKLSSGAAEYYVGDVTNGLAFARFELDGQTDRIDALANDAIAEGGLASVVDGVRYAGHMLVSHICDPTALADQLEATEAIAALMPGVRGFDRHFVAPCAGMTRITFERSKAATASLSARCAGLRWRTTT